MKMQIRNLKTRRVLGHGHTCICRRVVMKDVCFGGVFITIGVWLDRLLSTLCWWKNICVLTKRIYLCCSYGCVV